ncbi:MAG: hypothetical protein CMJ78_15820 [Planctomycetaceae bacterium]|nr:hypothetical protein [Planctomycetaceae bacterium]
MTRLANTFALIAVLVTCFSARLAANEKKKPTPLETIRLEDLKKHVSVLASDTLEGREAGTRGGKASSAYIKKQIQRIGVPGGTKDGHYFQEFRYEYRNILAFMEGSDPALKNEVIIVGGHYDHVGFGNKTNSYGPFGYIHNGADDNASGVALTLEVMEAFTHAGQPPKRSILFAFWDAEEKGLFGSKHWIGNPTVALQNVLFTVNADMVGRLRPGKFDVYGTRSARGVRQLITKANSEAAFDIGFTWDMQPDSDHWPFYEHAIPSLMLHTGKHDDYHRPSDDVDKINYEGIRSITRMTYRFLEDLANREDVPKFRRDSWNEDLAQQRQFDAEWPAPDARFGISWDRDQQEKDGVFELTGIARNYPAHRSGLQAGDRLITFWNQKLTNKTDLRALVLVAPDSVPIIIRRGDDEKEQTVTVELFGEQSPHGLGCDTDDAEPDSLIVKRVIAGSPAAVAGIEVNDRFHGIVDKSTDSPQELAKLIESATAPIELTLERAGRMRTVKLVPLSVSNRATE